MGKDRERISNGDMRVVWKKGQEIHKWRMEILKE
jgi:hypothetical protein